MLDQKVDKNPLDTQNAPQTQAPLQYQPKKPSSDLYKDNKVPKILVIILLVLTFLILIFSALLTSLSKQSKKTTLAPKEPNEETGKIDRQNNPLNSDKENILLMKDRITFSNHLMGSFSDISLYSDGSFLVINDPFLNDKGKGCKKGRISGSQYRGFIDYIKSTGIIKLKLTENDAKPSLCDGGSDLLIKIEGIEYNFNQDCFTDESDANEKIKSIIGEIHSKFKPLIDDNVEMTCPEGGYMNVIELDPSCDKPQTPPKNISDTSTLPTFLSLAIEKGRDYVYTGVIDEKIKSWDSQYIKLNNNCYYTTLYEFKGNNFD